MTRRYSDKDSITASAGGGFDVTPHATEYLDAMTRGVMVSEDDTTITGYLEADPENEHTTFGLKAGLMHPFRFIRITAVSGTSTVKGYY